MGEKEDKQDAIPKLELKPLPEKLQSDAYDNSRIYIAKMKEIDNKQISKKHFEPKQQTYLSNCQLHWYLEKLRSRWTSLFMIRHVFLNGVVEIKVSTNGKIFKVNGQRLKNYVERVDHSMYLEEIPLADPVYLT